MVTYSYTQSSSAVVRYIECEAGEVDGGAEGEAGGEEGGEGEVAAGPGAASQ